MNARLTHAIRSGSALPLTACVMLLAACGGGDGGDGASSASRTITLAGTAATGKALANAIITVNCVQGSMSVAADANGNYRATLNAATPCLITATSGATVLLSSALAGGTFNVTPETDLLLSYMAAELGTNEVGLSSGFATNAQFQQALANESDVLSAQAAVVQNLQQGFGVSLSTPDFLSASFTVGQPGDDQDLEMLLASGAVGANGDPAPAAVALMATTGAAHPIAPTSVPSMGGTGGTGGAGSTGGMM
jgi:hypothetical protein